MRGQQVEVGRICFLDGLVRVGLVDNAFVNAVFYIPGFIRTISDLRSKITSSLDWSNG